MKARVKATGEIVEVMRVVAGYHDFTNVRFYSENDIEIMDICSSSPPQSEATISGWVARDKSGYLVLHYKKPHRTLGAINGTPRYLRSHYPKTTSPPSHGRTNQLK